MKLRADDVPTFIAASVWLTVTDLLPFPVLSIQLAKLKLPAAHDVVCPPVTLPPRVTVNPASQEPVMAVVTGLVVCVAPNFKCNQCASSAVLALVLVRTFWCSGRCLNSHPHPDSHQNLGLGVELDRDLRCRLVYPHLHPRLISDLEEDCPQPYRCFQSLQNTYPEGCLFGTELFSHSGSL